MGLTISQIAAQITGQATSLDSVRRKAFLAWLQAHSSRVGGLEQSRVEITDANQNEESFENHLKSALIIWLDWLPVERVLWEYRLILHELAWWRALDEESVGMIVNLTDREFLYSSSSSDCSRILF